MIVYLVIDDREGLRDIVQAFDNPDAAEQYRAARANTDKEYGDYFLVEGHFIRSTFEGLD